MGCACTVITSDSDEHWKSWQLYLYLGTQKPEPGVCSWSCFPVVRPRKSAECAWVLLPLTALLSAGHMGSQTLVVDLGLHCVKTSCCPNNQGLLACLSITAWSLAHSWPKSSGFQPFCCVCEHLSSQTQGLKEEFLWKSLPWIYQECSRDLCVAVHGLLWWEPPAFKEKGVYPACILLCLCLLSFSLFKLLGS